ncbi:unnamed protein product [Caenorhabditis auriculariae]|uniref:Methyl-CpG binding protein 2/3 C-terminal domain-containing protein n=1 Tax=Caenorhabditis auriculariae TaxID=2777116 RepID=A0A8S1HSV7_9PELO|nr:unnamed protein product [Caenorhabditis auriculariae]
MGRPRVSEADPLGKVKRGRPSKLKKEETASRTGFEGETAAPWRKTVSVFKQSISIVTTSRNETKKAPEDVLKKRFSNSRRTVNEEKPFQLLWHKRMEGIQAMIPVRMADKADQKEGEYLSEALKLAGSLEKACDVVSEAAAAASLCNAIHHPKQIGAFGQKEEKQTLNNSLFLSVSTDQPMISAIAMSKLNEDIAAQEKRVLDCRKRLQEVMKHFGG